MSSAKRFNPVTAAANYAASQQQPRAWADRRGANASVAPKGSDLKFDLSPPNNPDTSIKCDGELTRIALGLKQSPLIQRWLPLHELARLTGRQGFTYIEYHTALERYGVKGCATYNEHMLRRGAGLYWNLHGEMIYPIGYVELAQRLIDHAARHQLYDLFLHGNNPGTRRDMYIDVSGSTGDFEGAILASWYALHGCPTISRYTLSALFNRDSRSIRRMERTAGIQVIYNEAETTDPSIVPLNADGDPRGDVYQTQDAFGFTVYHFRLANTYQAGMIRQHPRRGQGRRAAYSFERWLDATELHTNREGSGLPAVKLNPVTRTYCENEKQAKSSRKRGNVDTLYVLHRPSWGDGMVWRAVGGVSHDIYNTIGF